MGWWDSNRQDNVKPIVTTLDISLDMSTLLPGVPGGIAVPTRSAKYQYSGQGFKSGQW